MYIYIYIYIYIHIYQEMPDYSILAGEIPRTQEIFLAATADKKTCNYDTECSNRYPS